jgi:hypothetical protein
MDAARAPSGHGCPFGAGPRSNAGVRVVRAERGPNGGDKRFWLLLAGPAFRAVLPKVTRCKSETILPAPAANGYVPRASARARPKAIAIARTRRRASENSATTPSVGTIKTRQQRICTQSKNQLRRASIPRVPLLHFPSCRPSLTSGGTSSPAMRLRNRLVRASSNVVTGTVIDSRIGISQACITGLCLSAEK